MDGSPIRRDPLHATGATPSARELAFALVDAGYRRLAIVTSPTAPMRALCDELALTRLPPVHQISVGEAPDSIDRAFFTVFRGTHYPTGLVCSDAGLATAAVRSLRELGFSVPGEVMVVWPSAAAG